MRRWVMDILFALIEATVTLVLALGVALLSLFLVLLLVVAWVMWQDMATRFVPTRLAVAWQSFCVWGVVDEWSAAALRAVGDMGDRLVVFPGPSHSRGRGPPAR